MMHNAKTQHPCCWKECVRRRSKPTVYSEPALLKNWPIRSQNCLTCWRQSLTHIRAGPPTRIRHTLTYFTSIQLTFLWIHNLPTLVTWHAVRFLNSLSVVLRYIFQYDSIVARYLCRILHTFIPSVLVIHGNGRSVQCLSQGGWAFLSPGSASN